MNKKVEILVSGRVQGVFYRASTRDKAKELGLVGNVRNLPDGNVRIIASGESQLIDQLIEWCGTGPKMAKVKDVSVKETNEEVNSNFLIIR